MIGQNKHKNKFSNLLEAKQIALRYVEDSVVFSKEKKEVALKEESIFDFIHSQPEKLAAIIQSKLGLNRKVFARNCKVKKIERKDADLFLNQYHLMNSTSSAFNYGLFLNEELLAVASFSKGRKMNRLPEHKRSYELIRFCCKSGISVAGGLTKLVKNFCREKDAGDVMTYIDKQLLPGDSFIKAGFIKHSETAASSYLVHKITFERQAYKKEILNGERENYYLIKNSGNIKLVYTP